MTDLEKMVRGVEFTTSCYKRNMPGCSDEAANSYSTASLLNCYLRERQDWPRAYTRTDNIRDDMISLRRNDIKNELLKHAVCLTEYMRRNNRSEFKYLDVSIDPDNMSSDRIITALSNNIERGKIGIDDAYSYLDNNEILKCCISAFVETINDPERHLSVFSMSAKDKAVNNFIGDLDMYYMAYKSNPQDDSSMTGGYGSR